MISAYDFVFRYYCLFPDSFYFWRSGGELSQRLHFAVTKGRVDRVALLPLSSMQISHPILR